LKFSSGLDVAHGPSKIGMNAFAIPAARPASLGLLAFGLLLAVYFSVLTLVSGWRFTVEQFNEFWYYLLPLGAGFGLQVALYLRLRQVVHGSPQSRAVMAASGTTSTAAMISCCAHYLVNVAPVLGATGLVTLASQYQVEFFWVGLAFNAAGIAYIGSKLGRAARDHAQCAHA
jgi:Cu+-exporting ATPase